MAGLQHCAARGTHRLHASSSETRQRWFRCEKHSWYFSTASQSSCSATRARARADQRRRGTGGPAQRRTGLARNGSAVRTKAQAQHALGGVWGQKMRSKGEEGGLPGSRPTKSCSPPAPVPARAASDQGPVPRSWAAARRPGARAPPCLHHLHGRFLSVADVGARLVRVGRLVPDDLDSKQLVLWLGPSAQHPVKRGGRSGVGRPGCYALGTPGRRYPGQACPESCTGAHSQSIPARVRRLPAVSVTRRAPRDLNPSSLPRRYRAPPKRLHTP